jgi:hypothetical protein
MVPQYHQGVQQVLDQKKPANMKEFEFGQEKIFLAQIIVPYSNEHTSVTLLTK